MPQSSSSLAHHVGDHAVAPHVSILELVNECERIDQSIKEYSQRSRTQGKRLNTAKAAATQGTCDPSTLPSRHGTTAAAGSQQESTSRTASQSPSPLPSRRTPSLGQTGGAKPRDGSRTSRRPWGYASPPGTLNPAASARTAPATQPKETVAAHDHQTSAKTTHTHERSRRAPTPPSAQARDSAAAAAVPQARHTAESVSRSPSNSRGASNPRQSPRPTPRGESPAPGARVTVLAAASGAADGTASSSVPRRPEAIDREEEPPAAGELASTVSDIQRRLTEAEREVAQLRASEASLKAALGRQAELHDALLRSVESDRQMRDAVSVDLSARIHHAMAWIRHTETVIGHSVVVPDPTLAAAAANFGDLTAGLLYQQNHHLRAPAAVPEWVQQHGLVGRGGGSSYGAGFAPAVGRKATGEEIGASYASLRPPPTVGPGGGRAAAFHVNYQPLPVATEGDSGRSTSVLPLETVNASTASKPIDRRLFASEDDTSPSSAGDEGDKAVKQPPLPTNAMAAVASRIVRQVTAVAGSSFLQSGGSALSASTVSSAAAAEPIARRLDMSAESDKSTSSRAVSVSEHQPHSSNRLPAPPLQLKPLPATW